MNKLVHVKPSLYAHYFLRMKEVALLYGYNLVLHGSMNRDLDLVAIAWQETVKDHEPMIVQFAEILGGWLLPETMEQRKAFANKYHGRLNYVININRSCEYPDWKDPQYYIDISVIPPQKSEVPNGSTEG